MKSRITQGATKHLFTEKVLNKYDVGYFQCEETGFIQTTEPTWLDEAYASPIASLDIGLLDRNIHFSKIVYSIIRKWFPSDGKYVDFGGGYGVFTRLMRNRGIQFFRQDPLCKNLFADHFDWAEHSNRDSKADMVTAFEVCEHIVEPHQLFETLFSISDSIFFSTSLIPKPTPKSIADWWYFLPETGQHVSFYSLDSLRYLAKRFNASLSSNGTSLHFITRRSGLPNILGSKIRNRIRLSTSELMYSVRSQLGWQKSLVLDDFQFIKDGLRS